MLKIIQWENTQWERKWTTETTPTPTPKYYEHVAETTGCPQNLLSFFHANKTLGFSCTWLPGKRPSLQPPEQVGAATWLNPGQWRVTTTRTFLHPMGLDLGGCQPGQGHNAFDIMEDHTSHGACYRLNYIPLPKDMLKSYLGIPVTSKRDFIWNCCCYF